MQISHADLLLCPKCKRRVQAQFAAEQAGEIRAGTLVCEKGHQWPIIDGIPSLLYPDLGADDKKWVAEYDEIAEHYDEDIKQYEAWLDIDLKKERQRLAQFIPIEGPSRIIDVSIGTAANFEALANLYENKMGRFNLHGLDVSWGMLRASQKKASKLGILLNLVHGSVLNVPYADNTFDVVIHTGGINTFSDISGALREMHRVVGKGGFVVVTDEGISPKLRGSERGDAIIRANSLFGAKPPIQHIPDSAKDVEISYVMNDTFYQIVFRKG
jgi:ubiquinone/menaquinone biosynthesis C-methylase UbiE